MEDDWDVLAHVDEATPTKRKPVAEATPKSSAKQRAPTKTGSSAEAEFTKHLACIPVMFPMVSSEVMKSNPDNVNVKAWVGKSWLACERGRVGCVPCREASTTQGSRSHAITTQ
jgi:hypothetical protein